MEERIDIVVTDRVDTSTPGKLRAIGDGADFAEKALNRMKVALASIGAGPDLSKAAQAMQQMVATLPKAAQAQAILDAANAKSAETYLRLETALNRATQAEGRAAQQMAVTSAAQSKAAIAAAQVNTAYLEQERALFRALTAEQDLATATARAELAQGKLKTAVEGRKAAQQAAQSATQAEIVSLNAYSQAVVNATSVTMQMEIAKRQATYNPYAAGLQATVTSSYAPQARGALLGYQNPFHPGSGNITGARSGFAPAAGPDYTVAIQSTKELSLATEELGTKAGRAGGAFSTTGEQLGKVQQRGRLATNEMANLGFQLQDIVVSLAGGQNPFLVLLQQGAQIQGIYSMRGEGVGRVFGDIAGIITKFINPVTIAAAGMAALAFATLSFANKAADISNLARVLGVTTTQVQTLSGAVGNLSRGQLGFADLKKEGTDFGVALSNAARNSNSQLARLWKDNGLSLTDNQGKLKNFNDLLNDASRLVRNAGSEFDKIEIVHLMGLSEDWIRVLEKGPAALKAAQEEVKTTGNVMSEELIKRAATFDTAWETGWHNFTTNAGTAITQVKGFLADMILNGTQGIASMLDPILRDPKLYGLGPQGALGQAIGPDGKPVSVTGPITPEQQAAIDKSVAGALHVYPKGSLGQNVNGDGSLVSVLQDWAQQGRGQLASSISSTGRGAASLGLPSRPGTNGRPDNVGAPTISDLLPGGGNTVVPGTAAPKEDKTADKRADALARVNRELDAQITLLGTYGKARQVDQQMSEVENQLANKKITLDTTEKAGIKAKIEQIQQLQPVQAALNKMYQDAAGPMEDYNATIAAGNKLMADGVITADQYGKATRAAWEKVLEQQNTVGSGIELGFSQVYDGLTTGATDAAGYVKNAFSGLQDTFVQFATTGAFTFSNFTNQILSDIAKIIYQTLILKPLLEGLGLTGAGGATGATDGPKGQETYTAGSGGIGSFIGSAISGLGSLLGFANGGDFTVPGSTGIDRNIVAFKATRGERVQVTPADANSGNVAAGRSGPGSSVEVNVINQTGVQSQAREVGRRKGANGRDIVDVIVEKAVAAVASQIQNGGNDVTSAMSNRFGLNPATGNQL